MITTFSVSSCIWAFVIGAVLCFAIYMDYKDNKEQREGHR